MNRSLANSMTIAALFAVVSATGGCARVTPQQLAAVETKTDRAMAEARDAKTTADKSASAAAAAQKTADAASAKAADAHRLAEEAMSCCNQNKDRIERMFERTMKK
jgi:hypothetical protein